MSEIAQPRMCRPAKNPLTLTVEWCPKRWFAEQISILQSHCYFTLPKSKADHLHVPSWLHFAKGKTLSINKAWTSPQHFYSARPGFSTNTSTLLSLNFKKLDQHVYSAKTELYLSLHLSARTTISGPTPMAVSFRKRGKGREIGAVLSPSTGEGPESVWLVWPDWEFPCWASIRGL